MMLKYYSMQEELNASDLDLTPQQVRELVESASNFSFFAKKYITINHPKRGLVNFKLYEYQERVVNDFETHKYNIVSKFRQGGLTTLAVMWSMWRCMFKPNQQIMLLSKTDREAINAGKMLSRALDNLPDFIAPNMSKNTDHIKEFADTGSIMEFYTPEAARSKSLTYLIIDEAAFIKNMEEHWKAMYPTLSTGGNCIVISTVNGLGNWYEEMYHGAVDQKNEFHVIDLDYTEHPEYKKPGWSKKMRANLGPKAFQQEILRSFLGSGETYIPSETIGEIDKVTKESKTIAKLFVGWDSSESVLSDEEKEVKLYNDDWERGAFWIWEHPLPGREYIMGADAAEGIGEEGDYSAFHVVDSTTLTQVAEFYSNKIPIDSFAQLLYKIGLHYNTALLAMENTGGPSLSVLHKLQDIYYYENIYRHVVRKHDKLGLPMTRTLRPVVLEALQNHIAKEKLVINSSRFVRELRTFVYNKQSKRAEARRGFHDDLVMSMSIALYVKDRVIRSIPTGADFHESVNEVFDSSVIQEAEKALKESMPENWYEEEETTEEDEVVTGVMFDVKRPGEAILKEFGW